MQVAKDKQLHLLAGFLVAMAAQGLTESLWVAFLSSLVVGAAKEAYDALGHGTVDLWDFVATGIGGAIFVGLLLL
jgi:predicted regulator of Ras-like GTPase activity (Roadblock/LC7/MglB family)